MAKISKARKGKPERFFKPSFLGSMKVGEVLDLRDEDGAVDYFVDTEVGEFCVTRVDRNWSVECSPEVYKALVAFVKAQRKAGKVKP